MECDAKTEDVYDVEDDVKHRSFMSTLDLLHR